MVKIKIDEDLPKAVAALVRERIPDTSFVLDEGIFGTSDTPLQGLFPDTSISFNIRRSEENCSKFPRKVILLPSSPRRKSVIPGLMINKERALYDELREVQRWESVLQHSFEMPPSLFSFLWRFSTDPAMGLKEFRALEPVDSRMSKKIKTAAKKFKVHLRACLKPGHIYLVPDAEVAFNRQDRFKQPYARRVLIMDVQNDQVVIVPFSTKIERMDKRLTSCLILSIKGKDSFRMASRLWRICL